MTTSNQARPDYAAKLALFLTEKTGSCLGRWIGRMKAAEQRALYGRYLGKGRIIVDGETETLVHRVTACFGLDWNDTTCVRWRDL